MSCPIIKSRYDPIPDELLDKSLSYYPNHTMLTHLGCVLLRVVLGLFIINATNPKVKQILLFILILAVIVFGWKYMNIASKDIVLWKFYPRMLVSYSTAIYFILNDKPDLAGMMVILDSLIAFQSRHTTSVATCGNNPAKKNTKQVRFDLSNVI